MKLFLLSLSLILYVFASCSSPNVSKPYPEHRGVDPELEAYVNQFKNLSDQAGVVFNRQVTVGFKKINKDRTVGMCTFGFGWREIDIDRDYWHNLKSNSVRMALIYHELTHCYCTRLHDYAANRLYPTAKEDRVQERLEWIQNGKVDGRFDDGCPTSIMYPIVIEKECFLSHYNHYVIEMFDRCIPY